MWQQYYSSEECDQDTISVSQFRFTHSSADQLPDTMSNATFALHLSLIGFYASISIFNYFNLPFKAIFPSALRYVGNLSFPLLQLLLLFVGIILSLLYCCQSCSVKDLSYILILTIWYSIFISLQIQSSIVQQPELRPGEDS